jgi:hypothetical protein
VSAVENQPLISFQLKLANFANPSTPFSIIKKQFPVQNGVATITFESLPATTVVGTLQITNGNIDGYANFHGAADLNQETNIVELAPVGSLMPQDVVANSVSEIVSSTTLLLDAPRSLATELTSIVSSLPLDSKDVYDEVINNFTNRAGIPLVELTAPGNNSTFDVDDTISIVASATDLDGNISSVEFYKNSTKINETNSSPFSFAWQPKATGTYDLWAKVIDNNSAVGVSAPISVIIATRPSANAGLSQNILLGQSVTLDGSNSSVGLGKNAEYIWAIDSKPAGSDISIVNPTNIKTSFIPDLTGTYVFTLTVSDGSLTDISKVTISVDSLQSISVAPLARTISDGQTKQFFATGVFVIAGTKDISNNVLWESSSVDVATISDSGLATSVKPGNTIITATMANKSANTSLTVNPASLVSMSITNGFSIDLLDGQSLQLQLVGTYSNGKIANITEEATWSVPFFDANIVSVSDTTGSKGLVSTVGSLGTAQIHADYLGLNEVIFINVK